MHAADPTPGSGQSSYVAQRWHGSLQQPCGSQGAHRSESTPGVSPAPISSLTAVERAVAALLPAEEIAPVAPGTVSDATARRPGRGDQISAPWTAVRHLVVRPVRRRGAAERGRARARRALTWTFGYVELPPRSISTPSVSRRPRRLPRIAVPDLDVDTGRRPWDEALDATEAAAFASDSRSPVDEESPTLWTVSGCRPCSRPSETGQHGPCAGAGTGTRHGLATSCMPHTGSRALPRASRPAPPRDQAWTDALSTRPRRSSASRSSRLLGRRQRRDRAVSLDRAEPHVTGVPDRRERRVQAVRPAGQARAHPRVRPGADHGTSWRASVITSTSPPQASRIAARSSAVGAGPPRPRRRRT